MARPGRLAGVLAIVPALLLAGSVQAKPKPLPRNPLPPQETGCEAYGPGYRKLEGSDTCLRLGGSVRVETSVIGGSGNSFYPSR